MLASVGSQSFLSCSSSPFMCLMLPLGKMYQFVIAQSYSKESLDGSGCSRIGFHARLRRRTPDCGHYRTGAVVVGLVGPGCQRKMGHGRGGAIVGAVLGALRGAFAADRKSLRLNSSH